VLNDNSGESSTDSKVHYQTPAMTALLSNMTCEYTIKHWLLQRY